MLSVENRQALQRIDTGLVAMMRALQVVSALLVALGVANSSDVD